MAEKTIQLRDVSYIKHHPIMLMLREFHNAAKEEGEIFEFFNRHVDPKGGFKANVLHRGATLSKQEIAQYLEGYAKEMRECKYYHCYVEFLGDRTRPFIGKIDTSLKRLAVTSLMCPYEFGSLFMWWNKNGDFNRFIFIPQVSNETGMMDACVLLLDAEIYNYQTILPPAVWGYDDAFSGNPTMEQTLDNKNAKREWQMKSLNKLGERMINEEKLKKMPKLVTVETLDGGSITVPEEFAEEAMKEDWSKKPKRKRKKS